MRFHKFISVILHPIVIPTLGILLYFIIFPNSINSTQRLVFLGLIFVTTYIVPLLLMVILKLVGVIKSFKASTIKERKIPLLLMIFVFYALGNMLLRLPLIRDFGTLFYAISLGLSVVYVLFFFRFKTSLHLLSMGSLNGFCLMLNFQYGLSSLLITLILMLLAGMLGSARLHLNAHTSKEVYVGFLLGFFLPFFMNYLHS